MSTDPRPWRERHNIHPIARLEPDFTDEALLRAWWAGLGFEVHDALIGEWGLGNLTTDADGLWGTPPPVEDGCCRVGVWSDDDGHSYVSEVRPTTDYARALVAFTAAHGWPAALSPSEGARAEGVAR